MRAVGLTDQGLVRSNNEDAVWVDEKLGLLIVADGMGGHQSGEKASGITVTSIPANFKQLEQNHTAGEISNKNYSEVTNRLGFCVKMANQMIFEAASHYPMDNGMGTTCTAIVIRGDRLSMAHVGDSRCYLIRHGQMEQLSEDHSLFMDQVRHGILTIEDGARVNQNILTRSLGTQPEVKIDLDEHPLFAGDILLLCSDGLGKELTDAQVLQTVNETPEPRDLAKRLIEMANAAGGRDNTTVAVARMEKAGPLEMLKGLFKSTKG
jgi:serine/threonine protein phosphatase PrpC